VGSIRRAIVAGQFYPGNKEELIKAIESSFLHKLGKGKLPTNTNTKVNLKAIISPHAGYMFSGSCASHVFYEVGICKTPDTYILMD
jgi:hypothetical protein